jgi:S1-C subfamily serine protease
MFDRNLKTRFATVKESGGFRPEDVGDQETQHTIYWAPLPKALNFERRRFGAYTSDDNVRTGVQVVKVYAGESAETVTASGDGGSFRTSLRRGDILLEINGQAITDWNTYFELVRLSPRTMYFTFRRDGRIYNGETVLDY